jgi:hypothetical protein
VKTTQRQMRRQWSGHGDTEVDVSVSSPLSVDGSSSRVPKFCSTMSLNMSILWL